MSDASTAPEASAETSGTPRPASRRRALPLTVAVVAGLGAIALGLSQQGGEAPSPAAGPTTAATSGSPAAGATAPAAWMSEQHARRAGGDPLAKGEQDAPVALVVWSDFRCPFCGRWERETAPVLQESVDAGTLRIEWRDFPALGDESVIAAKAARAASQQGKFWQFHDRLFAIPHERGRITEKAMVAIADDLGLDTAEFTTAMRSSAVTDAIAQDHATGSRIGVTGTPAFLVGDAVIVGAQPTESFVSAVEQALTLTR